MTRTEITIAARDGYALPATLFTPEEPRAAVIMSSATATPRGFYRAFAHDLCEHGAAVLTYDYRGTFEPVDVLRRSTARMREWGTLDFPGAIDAMRERFPSVPLHAVGHSVGGHVLLMAPNNHEIARAVTVASQSGYWRLYRGIERYRVYAFVKAVMPLLTRINGYFPGSAVAFGTNLAPHVLYDWSRWCTSPGYFFDDPEMTPVLARARTFTAPTLMLGLSDDPWATARAIGALVPGFVNAAVARRELVPSDFGLGTVGHMGFFRAQNGAALWPLVLDALQLTTA